MAASSESRAFLFLGGKCNVKKPDFNKEASVFD